jgi:uncharacterized protein YraI
VSLGEVPIMMGRWIGLVLCLLFCATSVDAQTAVVKRNVNVRSDSSTNHTPIGHLKTGDKVELIAPSVSNGFFHIRMEDGTEGWAWSRNLDIQGAVAGPMAQHIGPSNLYPTLSMTPGKADTLALADLTKRYTEHCQRGKVDCTYSEAHRNVSKAVHTKVYDEYGVPQANRNKTDGEVDHFYPLCAGGSNDISNLWYQPAVNEWNGKNFGFHEKDLFGRSGV